MISVAGLYGLTILTLGYGILIVLIQIYREVAR